MKWSKLKQRIEDGFADSVQGRVEVWTTRYRRSHDSEGEGWITIDKERIHSMGSLTYLREWFLQSRELQAERNCEDHRDSSQIAGYRAAQNEVDQKLQDSGMMPLEDFNKALFDYLNLSIDQIVKSDKIIIRALGMFDRRLGKRRLQTMNVDDEQELVRHFHCIRCLFEGVQSSIQGRPSLAQD